MNLFIKKIFFHLIKSKTMRIVYMLMMCNLLALQATTVFSQNMVTMRGDNVPLKAALVQIEQNADAKFVYRDEIVSDHRVSFNFQNSSIEEALSALLKGTGNTYRILGNNLIVIVPVEISQGITISGTITDETGSTVPGVNVVVVGTTIGTISDVNGRYSIDVPNESAVLRFTSIGFATQNIEVGAQRTIDVEMHEDVSRLEEIVVVGYGTQRRINLTGAVDVVTSEVFENRSLSNTTQALQGAVPNLNINLSDGKPNRSASFNLRGATSIGSGGGSALILIDGVEGDPSFLNPNDIESVTVLKDAASAAVFGSRAAFGVVLITTKSPQKGRTTVNYTGNFSFQSIAKKPEYVTDAVTYLEHFRASFYNCTETVPTSINNNTQYYSDEWLDRMRAWKASGAGPKVEILPNGDYEYYSNTDWFALLWKDRTFVQDHNLNISGGNEKGDFYISGRYYDFGGMYNFDPDVYRSYNLRAKGSLMAYNWLRLFTNMDFSNTFYHQPYTTQRRDANVNRLIAVNSFPSQPMFNPDGTYTRSGAATLGAFADGNTYQDNTRNLFRNTFGFNTYFFDNKFRINGDYTLRYDSRDFFYKRIKVPYYQNIRAAEPAYMGDQLGIMYEYMGFSVYSASNIFGEYENTFSQKHYVKAMTGWNYETSYHKANNIQRNQILLENAGSIDLATGDDIRLGATATRWRTAGTFFRVNYGYDNRYLLELNGRYDGSSRFPEGQQWGFFPSVSGGWRLSEEPFWNVNQNVISDIKLRVSYGSLGNGNVQPYQFLETMSIGRSSRVLDGSLQSRTSAPAPIPDGLTWEKATTANFGLDLGSLAGRLRFSGDYYVRKTTEMYVTGPELPHIFGASAPRGNYAELTTKGFEITLTWKDKFSIAGRPFNYMIRGTLHDHVAVIDKFYNPTKRITQYYEGQVLGSIWGFETDGFFETDPTPDEYINTLFTASRVGGWRAGDLKIRNRDGSEDNQITRGENTVDNPGDLTIIGNRQPRYEYSFTFNADWNGIFFSVFFQGVGKQNWYPGFESPFWGQYNRGYNHIPAWHIGNYWTPENRNAYLPRYVQYNGTLGYDLPSQDQYHVPNDRYLQNVAYLRLKNIQLGYTLPDAWTSKINMRNARIYVSGENLICWSPFYKVAKNFQDVTTAQAGLDVDLNTSYDNGAGNAYPLLKTVSLGISLTF